MPSARDALDLLGRGAIAVKGRMPWSSNATFLVEVAHAGATTLAVYKPGRGERPLHDFPPRLFRREIAAWRLSEALGWGLVPPTVGRTDGPLGEGSLQLFVAADFEQHYFTLREDPAHGERLRRVCLFDLVANNADRKAGHCLLGADGLVYGVDNGLCFHAQLKLRTVIWDFGGETIPPAWLDDLSRVLGAGVPGPVAELLEPREQQALLARARAVAVGARFPLDGGDARYPWPLV